jgi:hypothetical protein
MKKMYGLMVVVALGSVGSLQALNQLIIVHNERDSDVTAHFGLYDPVLKRTLRGNITSKREGLVTIKAGEKATMKVPFDRVENAVMLEINGPGYDQKKDLPVGKTYKHYYVKKDGTLDHSKALAPVK